MGDEEVARYRSTLQEDAEADKEKQMGFVQGDARQRSICMGEGGSGSRVHVQMRQATII